MICNKCGYIMLDNGERGYVAQPPSMIRIEFFTCARCKHEQSREVELNDEM